MKKKIIAMLLTIGMAVTTLAGCTDKTNSKTAEGEVQAEEKETVSGVTMTDIYGEEYDTTDLFAEGELTLVNLFATWCGPCIAEMPELQKLQEEMADKGVKVVAVMMDSATPDGRVNEDAYENAKLLREHLGLTFPMLTPDETMMNGRLKGISAYPESFFVDKDGNIVSEPYVGARDLDSWKEVVDAELANLEEAN